LQNAEPIDSISRPIPMSFIVLTAAVVHLPLLMMELPLKSYDTNFHIFFASHYLHHWFDPWNPKWFGGFSQTTYPPLPQQWTAVLSHLFGLDMAYMAVQFIAIVLLGVGVYRFASIWVDARAASYAAVLGILLGSESFLVYNAGQLGTTSAAPLYLLALPYLYEFLVRGGFRAWLKAIVLFAAAAAAHHATLIFGSFFFALPILFLAFRDHREDESSNAGIVFRAVLMTVCVIVVAGAILLPFWIALFKYPITQTPIPHASRANFILSPGWGLNYFIIPYGALVLALPFIIWRGAVTPRLRPLMIGFWVCFLVGLGGTTPVAHWLLRRAFEVLTFERFTYWATLLALPIVGLLCADLVGRFRLRAAVPLGLLAALSCAGSVAWSAFRPTDNLPFSVDPVAMWLNRGGHDNYRYIVLGFGNKLSRLAMETDATSVDGEWYSERRLPELTKYGGGSLNAAKYFGKGGLSALRAILEHADRYGLKWVFVRDPYYDPLLEFAGFRQVDELNNGEITIWSRDGVPPATPVFSTAQMPPHWQGLMWGTLPFGSSILAILVVLLIPDPRRREEYDDTSIAPISEETVMPGRMVS